ncbi:MAG: B12-binding domain-containing radical SAM protein [Deltaproteobacteria bacterium]|nr:MAG: B12-binding domain-containing radical SAM protein [Deltaproteobacteria bacterium]
MNVLLIYPQFPETFWSFTHALKFIHKKAAYPPLGLLTVGAMLPKDWSVRLIDLNVTRLTDKDLKWADWAFISAMVVQRASALRVISTCKEAGVKTVAGGPLFTSEYQDFDQVDHLVLNEAEVTLPGFLEDLAAGRPKRIYQSSRFADIKQTPAPAWELVNMKHYAAMSVQFSRGCPFNCEFCNVTALFGHRPRIKDADQIIRELDSLYDLGWRGRVFFLDDNFIGNKRYLKSQLLPALIEWRKGKRGIPFNTEASLNLADDAQLMKMMVEAGFDTVFVGIETPDEEGLAECNKRQNTNRDLVQSIRIIQRSGLEVQGGFIVGFDSDKPSIFQRQIDFIQKSGIVTAMVGLLQAPVGTRLYERLKREGRLLGNMSGDTDGTTNIIPRMDPNLLAEGYRYIMRYIYSPRNYYKRVRVFLKEYQGAKAKIPLDFNRFLALIHSSIRLGIIGRERFQYWKTLLWTLIRRPRLLDYAITFAIYGYHFRRVAYRRSN